MDFEQTPARVIRTLQGLFEDLRIRYLSLDVDQQRWIKGGLGVLTTAAGLETFRRAAMTKKVFHSFHYERDVWRVSQIRNIGAIEEQPLLDSNEWEKVKRGGDPEIKRWIDAQMKDKDCVVVLAGRETAGRQWVDYEIKKGWGDGKGIVGVYIHRLEDGNGSQDVKGANPFAHLRLGSTPLSSVVRCYDPPQLTSRGAYGYIKDNIEDWVDEATKIRQAH